MLPNHVMLPLQPQTNHQRIGNLTHHIGKGGVRRPESKGNEEGDLKDNHFGQTAQGRVTARGREAEEQWTVVPAHGETVPILTRVETPDHHNVGITQRVVTGAV